MPRLLLLCLLSACLAAPSLAQRNRPRPPELPLVRPEAITLDQAPEVLDELVITFDRTYILSFDLLESELFTEFYLARQDDPENQRQVLVWVVEFVPQKDLLQTDRFRADDAWRYQVLRRKLDAEQAVVGPQMDYFLRNGPIWVFTAKERLKTDLPGAEVYYCATQLDDASEDIEYRVIFDARHDGELKRIVYASVKNEAVVEYLGPAPTNYRIDPFDTKNPVVMDAEADTRAPAEPEAPDGD